MIGGVGIYSLFFLQGEYALALEVVDKGLFADPTAVYLKNIRVELFEKVQKIRLDAFVTEMLALLESVNGSHSTIFSPSR